MVKYTDVHCLVDSHIKPLDAEQLEMVTDEIAYALDCLNTVSGYRAALAMDDPQKLKRVVMMNSSVEIGEKYGRLHAHFNLSIVHEGKFLLGEANAKLSTWFNEQFPWPQRCYASVELLESSRAKNYNAKSSRVIDHVAAEADSSD